MTSERGFVLLAVLLVLTLLAVVVTELAFSARLEASMVRSYRDGVLARHLAEAAVQQAMREIMSASQVAALDETGQLVFYRALPGQTTPVRLPALPRRRVALGPGEFSYRIADESARLGINSLAADRLDRLLAALRVDRTQRDIINDSLQDWRDANELHRLHGAESDFYSQLAVPYRARNGNLQDATELLQIRGVTRELYRGAEDRPGLGELVTAAPVSAVNINTASPLVLKAVGLSDAEIADVLQTRVRAPYPSVPGRFAGRGLTVGGSVFRIEAEGLIAGVPRGRAVAVVQRGRRNAPLEVTILSWRSGPDE
ncbi:MAG: general secretion pathway protein GspK [Candidatus Rokuibacteriota bacterium]